MHAAHVVEVPSHGSIQGFLFLIPRNVNFVLIRDLYAF